MSFFFKKAFAVLIFAIFVTVHCQYVAHRGLCLLSLFVYIFFILLVLFVMINLLF